MFTYIPPMLLPAIGYIVLTVVAGVAMFRVCKAVNYIIKSCKPFNPYDKKHRKQS